MIPLPLGGRARAFALALLLLPAWTPAAAQILSPGKLSRAHAALEGVRQCTQCHQLRQQGVSAPLCLGCHTPLAARLRAGQGYHADLGSDCAECHKEHLGANFALVRLDTAAFDHARAGYALDGAHAATACRGCHTPDAIADPAVLAYGREHGSLGRTFLGLPTACATCHADDDPHGSQFAGRSCSTCHTTASWEEAPGFAHERTRYPLTGRHAAVDCLGCHTAPPGAEPAAVTYRPLAFGSCLECHEDPHEGSMQGRCESCHTTAGWQRIDRPALERRFDHARTGFELVGRHGEVSCASCHDPRASAALAGIRIELVAGTARRAYPRPRTGSCLSCHVDAHAGAFADAEGGADCASCHGQQAWLPAGYDLARHDRDVRYALTGAHRAVACADCHRSGDGTLELHPPSAVCTDCHAGDDPHAGQFAGRACTSCHDQETFRLAAFDHSRTRYPLDGRHDRVPCASCHEDEEAADGKTFVRYAPLGTACRDCHGGGA